MKSIRYKTACTNSLPDDEPMRLEICTCTLFSGSDPVGLPPVPWTEKTIESSPFFVRRGGHCCRRDLIGRTTF